MTLYACVGSPYFGSGLNYLSTVNNATVDTVMAQLPATITSVQQTLAIQAGIAASFGLPVRAV